MVDRMKNGLQALGFSLLTIGLLAIPARAQAPEAGVAGSGVKIDYALARRDIRDFEAVVDGVIGASFSNPFGLVQKPKGVYLQGYGVMLSFLINIHRGMIRTPFGDMPSRNNMISAEQKKQRIEAFKEKLVQTLLEQGTKLRQLDGKESVTIVAFFEDRNFPDEENQNKTIIMSVKKSDLDEWSKQGTDWTESRGKVRIIEY